MASSIDPNVLAEALEDGLDDWVFLIDIGGYLSRHLALPDATLCEGMRTCVATLVDEGLFEPGTIEEPTGFVPLAGPVDDVFDRICDGWAGWDDPEWGYALALRLTPLGRAAAT